MIDSSLLDLKYLAKINNNYVKMVLKLNICKINKNSPAYKRN